MKRAGGRRYYRPEDVDLLRGIRALLYREGFTIKGVQKVLRERGLRYVAELGRGEVHEPEPPQSQVQVIEKIVYVEKSAQAPAPRKPRTPHLRAVPGTLDLPFFDELPLSREFPVLDAAPPKAAGTVTRPEVTPAPAIEAMPEGLEDSGLVAEDMERLEELLDELKGLKTRLQAARERF